MAKKAHGEYRNISWCLINTCMFCFHVTQINLNFKHVGKSRRGDDWGRSGPPEGGWQDVDGLPGRRGTRALPLQPGLASSPALHGHLRMRWSSGGQATPEPHMGSGPVWRNGACRGFLAQRGLQKGSRELPAGGPGVMVASALPWVCRCLHWVLLSR